MICLYYNIINNVRLRFAPARPLLLLFLLSSFDGRIIKVGLTITVVRFRTLGMTVPHHASGVLKDGHQEFESWVLTHWNEFDLPQRGCYQTYRKPLDWIRYSVAFAKPYLPMVSLSQGATVTSFTEAARFLVPLIIRISAGFLVMAHTALRQLPIEINNETLLQKSELTS